MAAALIALGGSLQLENPHQMSATNTEQPGGDFLSGRVPFPPFTFAYLGIHLKLSDVSQLKTLPSQVIFIQPTLGPNRFLVDFFSFLLYLYT